MVTTKGQQRNELEEVSIQMLGYLCQAINRISTKRLKSYKQTKDFIKKLGVKTYKLDYINSYVYKNVFVDVYEYKQGGMLIYSKDEYIIGCKVYHPNYVYRKYLKEVLKNYSMLEIANAVIFERKY